MTPVPFCSYPFTHFEVNNPNGDVTFCCNHHLVLGNVNRESIAEIWNGERYQEVRRRFLAGELRSLCSRDCPVLAGWKDYEKLDWYRELPETSPVRRNAVLNEEEIAAGQTVLRSTPRWIRFAASYACNLKCYHCFQAADRDRHHRLPAAFGEAVKRYLPALQILFLYGGEPLLEPTNLELLRFVGQGQYPVRIFLVSNGTVLNDELKVILEKLNYGLISLSVDSIRKARYEELRFPAQWETTRAHLEYFAGLMRAKRGLFDLSLTINKQNYDELPEYVDFCRALGAVPVFQFAGNAFQDEKFRATYEIHRAGDFKSVRAVLAGIRDAARPDELPATTRRNLDHLIGYADRKLREQTLAGRMMKRLTGGLSRLRRGLRAMATGNYSGPVGPVEGSPSPRPEPPRRAACRVVRDDQERGLSREGRGGITLLPVGEQGRDEGQSGDGLNSYGDGMKERHGRAAAGGDDADQTR